MVEKPNQLPHPQTALNKFMVRILFERDQLVQAYNLDGKTVSIFKVKPPNRANNLDGNTVSIFKVKPPNRANNLDGNTYPDIDDINGLVDSQLEDMYHSLYGETPQLPKLIEETKTECCMVDANFAGILISPLNAMVKVHKSCIEDLRNGKGWNWGTHSEAFEELKQLSGAYASKLIKMTINPAGQTTLESTLEISPTVIKPTTRKYSKSKKVQGLGETIHSDLLFCASLVKHHGYENDICTSFAPLSCTDLGSSLNLSKNTASLFFLKKFKGHQKYVNMCSDSSLLNTAMKMLSGEASFPHILLGDAAKNIKGKPDPESDL